MKKIFLLLQIFFFFPLAHCQTVKKEIQGSWINSNIQNYYKAYNTVCDLNSFGSDVVPLYLTFKDSKTLNITFKIEQKIFTYRVIKTFKDSVIIKGNGNTRVLYTKDNTLSLNYNGQVIPFTKVSDSYSKDVFAEFIKSEVFKEYDKYIISSYIENKDFDSMKVDRNNFESILKSLFKCDDVNIVTLGLFEYQNHCLPEIAIYYGEQDKRPSPRTLGIMKDNDSIRFIDASGTAILTLKGVR
jgi:hypothetical protein